MCVCVCVCMVKALDYQSHIQANAQTKVTNVRGGGHILNTTVYIVIGCGRLCGKTCVTSVQWFPPTSYSHCMQGFIQ